MILKWFPKLEEMKSKDFWIKSYIILSTLIISIKVLIGFVIPMSYSEIASYIFIAAITLYTAVKYELVQDKKMFEQYESIPYHEELINELEREKSIEGFKNDEEKKIIIERLKKHLRELQIKEKFKELQEENNNE